MNIIKMSDAVCPREEALDDFDLEIARWVEYSAISKVKSFSVSHESGTLPSPSRAREVFARMCAARAKTVREIYGSIVGKLRDKTVKSVLFHDHGKMSVEIDVDPDAGYFSDYVDHLNLYLKTHPVVVHGWKIEAFFSEHGNVKYNVLLAPSTEADTGEPPENLRKNPKRLKRK